MCNLYLDGEHTQDKHNRNTDFAVFLYEGLRIICTFSAQIYQIL